MTNIFKLHEYQTFGLMQMHNMSNTWFAYNKFSMWKSLVYDQKAVENAVFKFLSFLFLQISDDYSQKSYSGFPGYLGISTTSQMFLIYTFVTVKLRPF